MSGSAPAERRSKIACLYFARLAIVFHLKLSVPLYSACATVAEGLCYCSCPRPTRGVRLREKGKYLATDTIAEIVDCRNHDPFRVHEVIVVFVFYLLSGTI